jgi:hypothetical protein
LQPRRAAAKVDSVPERPEAGGDCRAAGSKQRLELGTQGDGLGGAVVLFAADRVRSAMLVTPDPM